MVGTPVSDETPVSAGSQPRRLTLNTGKLRNVFPGSLIARFGEILWPPRFPDLTALVLQDLVFPTHVPKIVEDLRTGSIE